MRPNRNDPAQRPDALAEPEETTADLFDHAPCGYFSTLEDGTIDRVNETFLRWTGYTRDQIVGQRRFQDLLTAGGRIYHETHYAPMLRMQGWAREIAVEIVRDDGTTLPALINSTLKVGNDAGQLAIRTIVFDATERRRYEQELLSERKRAQASEAEARLLLHVLQEALIPQAPSQIPGMEVAALYRPAGVGDIVGGDFYDVFETPRGDWAVVLGDVTGKGVKAARATAAARYILRANAMRSSIPHVVLAELNEALLLQGFELCTAVFARVSQEDDQTRLTIASAGHPLPIVVSSEQETSTLGRSGCLLAALDGVVYEDVVYQMAPGDSVIFYTDGVTEARRDDGEFFGEQRLDEVLRSRTWNSASDLCSALGETVVAFQADRPRDDIAILVLHKPG